MVRSSLKMRSARQIKRPKLDDSAVKDEKGRYLCYDFAHGKCLKGDQCTRYHGRETTATKLKRLQDEKRMAERKSTALAAKLESVESADKPENITQTTKGKKADSGAEASAAAGAGAG